MLKLLISASVNHNTQSWMLKYIAVFQVLQPEVEVIIYSPFPHNAETARASRSCHPTFSLPHNQLGKAVLL